MNNKVEPSDAVIEADIGLASAIVADLDDLKAEHGKQAFDNAIDELKLRASGIGVQGYYADTSQEAADIALMALKEKDDSPDSRREIQSVLDAPESNNFMGDSEGRYVQLSEASKNPQDAERIRGAL